MRVRTWGYLAAIGFATTAVFAPSAFAEEINPDVTIEVANLNPVQGEDVPITNADNDDSRCVGGIPVVFVNGLPPGILSQLVGTPDAEGNWEVTLHVPFQADLPE